MPGTKRGKYRSRGPPRKCGVALALAATPLKTQALRR